MSGSPVLNMSLWKRGFVRHVERAAKQRDRYAERPAESFFHDVSLRTEWAAEDYENSPGVVADVLLDQLMLGEDDSGGMRPLPEAIDSQLLSGHTYKAAGLTFDVRVDGENIVVGVLHLSDAEHAAIEQLPDRPRKGTQVVAVDLANRSVAYRDLATGQIGMGPLLGNARVGEILPAGVDLEDL